MLLKLARLSLWNRRSTATLTLLSLTISIVLLLAIDHLRHQAKNSFSQTVSGTDLIVGARGDSLNLLLYSVFHLGNASNNISWDSYRELADHPSVAWTLPLSLGDSHRGFRVLGTSRDYFEHYQYGQRRSLAFAEGRAFETPHEAVAGAQVARQLGYAPGREIVVAHGTGAVSFSHHDEDPFTIVGVLEPTGTPVDRTVHVSLAGIAAIHQEHGHEHQKHGHEHHGDGHERHEDGHERHEERHETESEHAWHPDSITAALVGLKSRAATFSLQREINTYEGEPLMAILPGVALTELWQMLSMVENLLYVIGAMVLLAALIGMVTMLLASMKERQREIAVLRAVGAGRGYVFWLVELEVLLLTLGALALGTALTTAGLWLAQPFLAARFGLFISVNPLSVQSAYIMLAVVVLAALSGAVPAAAAYRRALAEGLNPRL